ncbi:hypothetical protein HBB16_02800 [Pseudonocardia sp. MCCB 268]|nr:hypothetical protein [Pseudonocardia cytotoxica]
MLFATLVAVTHGIAILSNQPMWGTRCSVTWRLDGFFIPERVPGDAELPAPRLARRAISGTAFPADHAGVLGLPGGGRRRRRPARRAAAGGCRPVSRSSEPSALRYVLANAGPADRAVRHRRHRRNPGGPSFNGALVCSRPRVTGSCSSSVCSACCVVGDAGSRSCSPRDSPS